MDEYKKYLAEQILTEDKVITYRYLSRALKVHVNTAKQMLYDFYKWQNDKRPGAVHATYLVYGTKKVEETNGHIQHDGDVEMTSSMPEVESLAEEVPVFTLSMVAEDKLNDVLSQYEHVSALHVYSLGPQPVKDWQLLSDAARSTSEFAAANDSEASRKIFGSIISPYVRRRERKGAASAAQPAATAKIKDEPKVKEEAAPTPPGKEAAASAASSAASSAVTKKSTPGLKRGGSGGIMQSFAKAAAMPKKPKSSQPATPSAAEDSGSMQALSDDGEDDSTAMPEPQEETATARNRRKEREAELRRMMEEDDEEPEETPDTPMEEPEEEPPAEPEPEKEPEPAEVVSSTGDGRKRGKRRVMRKKQILDDQGYLVTIQEPGWESFSEDETPAPPKKKAETSAPSSQSAKPKKSGPKGSQGSIMSFFSKK
ncbi:DNA polymerase delta subunit 3 [Pleurostoma richardsiae]|uniref:DNA polymerase delta subunit 3 n=1 Tax=Pleurostoma richardsiae TaxID=41990 RepID=A0AA38VFP9_9PEZI|nr:DNA polymerase delta subunit 3 [Pleurostoma richardsiae]